MFTVLNEAIQADMEHLQTGTQTVPCVVTQALMKMDAGLTANLGKIRNTACCMLAMQKECWNLLRAMQQGPTCFWFGDTNLYHLKETVSNKQKLGLPGRPGSPLNGSIQKKKKKNLPKNHGRVCLVSSEAVHHGKH